jgi:hypothetical protein
MHGAAEPGYEPTVRANLDRPADQVRAWAARQAASYRHGEERPLGGYLVLMGTYAGVTAAAGGIAKLLGREPAEPTPRDLVMMTLAVQKVSRLITKDPVTSPLRAPFTSFADRSAPGELAEEVRGHGIQHSVGELLTCPMCIGQWVATAMSVGLVLSPRLTRQIMGTFAAIGAADFLQHAYAGLQQLTD